MNYINGGLPLEFEDELPDFVPMPLRRAAKAKKAAAARGQGQRSPVSRSPIKSPSRGTPRSPVKVSSRSSPKSPIRSPSKSSSRLYPSPASKKPSSPPKSKRLSGKSVRSATSTMSPAYRAAFDTQYLAVITRLSAASAQSLSSESLSLEERRMDRAVAECLRDMLSNQDIVETIKFGCMMKLKKAGHA